MANCKGFNVFVNVLLIVLSGVKFFVAKSRVFLVSELFGVGGIESL